MESLPWPRAKCDLFSSRLFGCAGEIQIPHSSLGGQRPKRSDGSPMRKHGSYSRYSRPDGSDRVLVQRYYDPTTGKTVSVLPPECLPYRPIPAHRFLAFLDHSLLESPALDPPPNELEAGCLSRAFRRFLQRQHPLRVALGQRIPALANSSGELWRGIRRFQSTLDGILSHLWNHHKISLLGDYRCCKG